MKLKIGLISLLLLLSRIDFFCTLAWSSAHAASQTQTLKGQTSAYRGAPRRALAILEDLEQILSSHPELETLYQKDPQRVFKSLGCETAPLQFERLRLEQLLKEAATTPALAASINRPQIEARLAELAVLLAPTPEAQLRYDFLKLIWTIPRAPLLDSNGKAYDFTRNRGELSSLALILEEQPVPAELRNFKTQISILNQSIRDRNESRLSCPCDWGCYFELRDLTLLNADRLANQIQEFRQAISEFEAYLMRE